VGLISAGICDIGRKRKTNQDSIYMNPERNLFIVADGMGGHNGGDIASALAVKSIPDFFVKESSLEPTQLLEKSVQFANETIKNRGKEDPLLVGMGTTVVSFFFKETSLYIANVGDSRAYLVNNHRLYQLTRDHSLVQEKLNIGIYNRDQAQKDPQKNVLVRTVGFEDHVEVDIYTYKVCRHDIFLCCSDGLHGKVSDADIVYIINKFIPDPSKATPEALNSAVKMLVHQANANGGNDNISVILIVAK
jgi:PPM family protein phosphatase